MQSIGVLHMQALQHEVQRRQRAVLEPVKGGEEAGMSMQARQARLNRARSLLAERMEADALEVSAAFDGGFL